MPPCPSNLHMFTVALSCNKVTSCSWWGNSRKLNTVFPSLQKGQFSTPLQTVSSASLLRQHPFVSASFPRNKHDILPEEAPSLGWMLRSPIRIFIFGLNLHGSVYCTDLHTEPGLEGKCEGRGQETIELEGVQAGSGPGGWGLSRKRKAERPPWLST